MTTDAEKTLLLADRALDMLAAPDTSLSRVAVVAYQLATNLNDANGIGRMEQLLRSTARLESEVEALRAELAHVSTNPFQGMARSGSLWRQQEIVGSLSVARSQLTQYVAAAQKQLQFTSVASDLFERSRARVDAIVRAQFADAAGSFAIAYANLRSDNPESWSLAATACRRLLKALADHIFPARDEPLIKGLPGGKQKKIELTDDKYRNRLVAFVNEHSSSDKFGAVVGSHLELLIDRLEAVDESLSKGVHAKISREEADAYVMYTYLLVGDILSLMPRSGEPAVQ